MNKEKEILEKILYKNANTDAEIENADILSEEILKHFELKRK